MLKTRIITALVILPIVLVALFAFPRWGWAAFALAILSAAAWEWRRFCKFTPGGAVAYYSGLAGAAVVLGGAYFVPPIAPFANLAMWVFAAALVFWFLLVPLWLLRQWRAPSAAIDALAGAVVLVPMLVALPLLRDVSPWLLLSFAAIVWVADIAAYFAGKAFGKHKLAPTISPGKTIEGVVGGLAGVALYFFLWRWLGATFLQGEYWMQAMLAQGGILLLFFLVLGGISVVGDLFESWMKRGAGLKDSSGLLPGHGGILDRIDALTSTLPVAALFTILIMRAV